MKFWPQDWSKDAGLSLCSLDARGLWIEMMAIMHECEPYGHLCLDGRAMTVAELSKLVKAHHKTVIKALKNLDKNKVFSRTIGGIIYSRRMVKDYEISQISAINWQKGGNELLKKRITPQHPSKPQVDKPQDTEAESEEKESPTEIPKRAAIKPSLPPREGPDFETWWAAYPARLHEDGKRKKVGKAEAKAAFETALKKTDATTLLEAVQRYASATDPRYVMDAVRWIKRERWQDEELPIGPSTNGHAGVQQMPEIWDGDELWAPFCDGESSYNGKMRPSVNGWCLPEAAIKVAEAAKLPHTFREWKPLIAWLNDGFTLQIDIIDVIREIASRPRYSAGNLRYFDNAVRANTTEWDYLREPKAAKSQEHANQH